MDKLIIEGGARLSGEVTVSGAKNAVLPILAATLLTDDACVIRGVPYLRDTQTMIKILRSLGKVVEFDKGVISLASGRSVNCTADYKLVSTMRASFCVLGPLLAKFKKAKVSLPGGCVIGVRPVDLHVKGLKSLGAAIDIDSGYVVAKADRLKGCHIYLGGVYGSSVLATDNVMMAAVLARGRTVIESAACEPEVVDLADFLIRMGAKIKGYGTPSGKSLLEGKPVALLVTCDGPIANNADLIQEVFDRVSDYCKCRVVGKYVVPFCMNAQSIDTAGMEIANKMAGDILSK